MILEELVLPHYYFILFLITNSFQNIFIHLHLIPSLLTALFVQKLQLFPQLLIFLQQDIILVFDFGLIEKPAIVLSLQFMECFLESNNLSIFISHHIEDLFLFVDELPIWVVLILALKSLVLFTQSIDLFISLNYFVVNVGRRMVIRGARASRPRSLLHFELPL